MGALLDDVGKVVQQSGRKLQAGRGLLELPALGLNLCRQEMLGDQRVTVSRCQRQPSERAHSGRGGLDPDAVQQAGDELSEEASLHDRLPSVACQLEPLVDPTDALQRMATRHEGTADYAEAGDGFSRLKRLPKQSVGAPLGFLDAANLGLELNADDLERGWKGLLPIQQTGRIAQQTLIYRRLNV